MGAAGAGRGGGGKMMGGRPSPIKTMVGRGGPGGPGMRGARGGAMMVGGRGGRGGGATIIHSRGGGSVRPVGMPGGRLPAPVIQPVRRGRGAANQVYLLMLYTSW